MAEVSKISDLKSGKGPSVSDEDIDRVRDVKQEPESSKVEGMALAWSSDTSRGKVIGKFDTKIYPQR